jgi:hypothetical protein
MNECKKNYYQSNFKKIRLMLRTTVFLAFLSTGLLWANNAHSQKVYLTLTLENVTVGEMFREIERNSEFVFVFRDGDVDLDRLISVKVKRRTLDDILKEAFKGTGNSYEIYDRQVVLTKRPISVAVKSSLQGTTITGIITDENGAPMAGASIQVQGSTRGVAMLCVSQYDVIH